MVCAIAGSGAAVGNDDGHGTRTTAGGLSGSDLEAGTELDGNIMTTLDMAWQWVTRPIFEASTRLPEQVAPAIPEQVAPAVTAAPAPPAELDTMRRENQDLRTQVLALGENLKAKEAVVVELTAKLSAIEVNLAAIPEEVAPAIPEEVAPAIPEEVAPAIPEEVAPAIPHELMLALAKLDDSELRRPQDAKVEAPSMPNDIYGRLFWSKLSKWCS